jgi:ribulose-phosphate 3-epimerase
MIGKYWKIIPAIIAPNQEKLDIYLSLLEGKARNVMLDFMDGSFVPQKSMKFEPELSGRFNYEGHLMVEDPLTYLELLYQRVERISFHVETVTNIEEVISYARKNDFFTSLAINPGTSVDNIIPYLNEVDGVLIMTVEPGRYGGKFLPYTLEKVRKLRDISSDLHIEVDGGMDPVNAKAAKDAGANAFASGSYIFGSGDIEKALEELEKAVS